MAYLSLVGNVGADRRSKPAGGADILRRFLYLGRCAGCQDNVRSLLRQGTGNRLPYPPPRTGHHRDLSRELLSIHGRSPLFTSSKDCSR